jgi:UDP-N-acetyl-2-amino-2-deoxyglucuronate dehydrogenase
MGRVSPTPVSEIGCAIVGLGAWGTLLAAELEATPGLRLTGTAGERSGDGARRPAHAREHAGLPEVLEDPTVDAVLIVVPNALHTEYALAAIGAGKHVLLEKPMALTVADALAIDEAARGAGVVLMLDHIQRYYDPLVALRQLVDDGALGELQALAVSRRDRLRRTKPWLQQREHVGGLLYQSACHEYDVLRWLCGEAEEIHCLAGPRVIAPEPLDYPDTILSLIRFRSGAVAQVWNCMSDPLMGYDGTVTGTEGTAWFDLYDARLRWRRLDGEADERRWTPADQWAPWRWMESGGIADGEAAAIRRLLADFRAAIAGEIPVPITGEDGLRSIEMAQAGYQSIASGRPVTLPLPAEERARRPYLEVSVGHPEPAR